MQRLLSPVLLMLVTLVASAVSQFGGVAATNLPSRLSDREFWRLIVDLSEPGGAFQSDNLTSNEGLGLVAKAAAQARPGRVYVGVGPEQNFSYIAALDPAMAIIVDIRRGNLHLQLMYKALFELSADRAEFVSRLFTRPRPDGLDGTATVTALLLAYRDVPRAAEPVYAANLSAIHHHLTRTRGLPLTAEDLEGIGQVYRAFFWYGLDINYAAGTDLRAIPDRGGAYRELMLSMDQAGLPSGFLASEETFARVKALHARNLVVPVVGDFAGPRALRGIGAFLKERSGIVGAFYVSNVEDYLRRDNKGPAFCANLLAMPFDESSVLIRPSGRSTLPGGVGVVPMTAMIGACR